MRFRTIALALALACGLSGLSEAKTTKKTVVRRQYKPGKAGKKFKAAKVKAPKHFAKKTARKH